MNFFDGLAKSCFSHSRVKNDLSVDQANQLDMLLFQDFTRTEPVSKAGSKRGIFVEEEPAFRLMSGEASSRRSFDLKDGNLSSIMG